MFSIIKIHNTNIYLEIRIDTVENHQHENSPDKEEDTTTIIDAREARAMRQSEVRDQFQKEKKQEYRDKKQAKIMYVD